ncbi:MAG: GNAT family N-acetyltransferase, partial [Proteobacteria bacterium]
MQAQTSLAFSLPQFPFHHIQAEWRPKITFRIRQGRYTIKTAETKKEFEDTILLRSEVFLREFAGKASGEEIDIDPIDEFADFLIIKDNDTDETLASYRLIHSDFSREFYSQSEFLLTSFLRSPGKKLELSRACIRADKRSSGIFLHLLWKGLGRYIQLSRTSKLFGCSSIQTLKLGEIVNLYHTLRDTHALSSDYSIRPTSAYRMVDSKGILKLPKRMDEAAPNLPPLLMGYIKAGAKVHGEPA